MIDNKTAWQAFGELAGVDNILPIAQAVPEYTSKLAALGKVPSIILDDKREIVGYARWQKGRTTAADIKRWANDPRMNIGLRLGHPAPGGGVLVAIDADVEEPQIQQTIYELIKQALHGIDIPRRVRSNSERTAYLLRVITPAADTVIDKKILKLAPAADGKQRAVEILGRGQQLAVWGVHPSGAVLEWVCGATEFTSEPQLPDMDGLTLTLDAYNALQAAIAEAVPVTANTTKKARKTRSAQPGETKPDEVAIYLDENGWTLSIGADGERFIRSPFEADYSTEQGEGDTSVVYFSAGSGGYEQGHFVSLHASDADRTDGDFLMAIGFIADQFEALPQLQAEENDAVYNGLFGKGRLLDLDGRTGKKRMDNTRCLISSSYKIPLQLIPPMVKPRFTSKGELSGFTPLNHPLNLRFVLETRKLILAKNEMTGEVELLNSDGSNATRSAASTSSMVNALLAESSIPLDTMEKHFDALAELNSYHPVRRLLHGKKWDGKERVKHVLKCINAENQEYAEWLIKKTLIAAIAALEESSVAMKTVPVLYSRENNWFKTAFIKRLFDILPNAFLEGLSVDPRHKDSLRPAVSAWGVELGELDSMSRIESGYLKAWIPNKSDRWRAEYRGYYTDKPRQTVYMATVNKDDFISDETLASRFPVIRLKGPIHIEALNKYLGWEHNGKQAELTKPDQLIQFWLEVREDYLKGEGYAVSNEQLAQMQEETKPFVKKLMYQDQIEYHLTLKRGDDMYQMEMIPAVSVCIEIGEPQSKSSPVGKAMKHVAINEGLRIGQWKNKHYFEWPVTAGHGYPTLDKVKSKG